MNPSPYLTAAEAMDYLRLGSKRALTRMISENALPFCRLGRHYRFDIRELDAWLRGHGSALERQRVDSEAGMTWFVDRVVALLRWLERPRLAPLPPTQSVSEHWLRVHVYSDGHAGDR